MRCSLRVIHWIVLVCLLAIAMPGCVIVQVGVTNPVPSLSKIAVAPFFNLSQEKAVDGRRFAMAYFAELQKIPGFQVVPVGVTEQAIFDNRLEMDRPEDAIRLAGILGVDIVVLGAVTDYDPYYPPRVGLQVSWYSPQDVSFCPIVDSFATTESQSDSVSKHSGRQNNGLRAGRGWRVRRTHCIRSQTPKLNGVIQDTNVGDGWLPIPEAESAERIAEDASGNDQSSMQNDPSQEVRRTDDGSPWGERQPAAVPEHLSPVSQSDGANSVWNSSTDIDGDAFWQESAFWGDMAVERASAEPAPASLPVVKPAESAESSVAIISHRDFQQPIMSYTRLFDGADANLVARLRDYVELSGDRRSGDWEAYLHRSEDFIRFTSHVMIVEMLTLHGGETRHRFVFKLRKYR